MEIRLHTGEEWLVTSVDPGGATVKRPGKSMTISITSEVDYKYPIDTATTADIESAYRDKEDDMTSRASALPVAEKQKNHGGPCMCGCNEVVAGYFKRGHASSYMGRLRSVARGEQTPFKAFGRSLAMRLGPWTENKQGGVDPSKTYRDLR